MKKIRNYIDELELCFRNEIIKIILIDVVFVGAILALSILFLKNILIIVLGLFLTVLIDILYFSRYQKLINKKHEKTNMEFEKITSFISDGIENDINEKKLLSSLIPLVDEKTGAQIDTFLEKIKAGKIMDGYSNFIKYFNDQNITKSLLSMYCYYHENKSINLTSDFDNKNNKKTSYISLLAVIGIIVVFVTLIILVSQYFFRSING